MWQCRTLPDCTFSYDACPNARAGASADPGSSARADTGASTGSGPGTGTGSAGSITDDQLGADHDLAQPSAVER